NRKFMMAIPTPRRTPSAANGGARMMATRNPKAPTMMAESVVRRRRRGSVSVGRFSSTSNGFLKETPDLLDNAHHGGDRSQHYPDYETPRSGPPGVVGPESENHERGLAKGDGESHGRERDSPREP